MKKPAKFSGMHAIDRRRSGNKILSLRGISAAKFDMEVINSIAKRNKMPPPSGRMVVCGCGDLTCCFWSSDVR